MKYRKAIIIAIVLLAVLGGVALTNAQTKNSFELNKKVAELDIDNAGLEDVIEVFGEPLKYA